MELASRDVISRSEQTEIDEGRGLDGNVLLDLRHLGADRIIERLPGTRELAMTFKGIDPIFEPIPVRPGAHYHMGGVDTDVWARRSSPACSAPAGAGGSRVTGRTRPAAMRLLGRTPSASAAGRPAPAGRLSP